MFDKTVYVKIVGDKKRYKERAEKLGYKLYMDMPPGFNIRGQKLLLFSEKDSLFNQRNYSITNRLPYSYSGDLITEEEFFGETMLENLDLRILSVLVNLTCETLDSFSAYDVTTILRSRLPNFNILHKDVRDAVVYYVNANANMLRITDNGTYLVYNRKTITTETQLDKLLKEKASKVSKILPLQSEGRVNITELIKTNFPKDKFIYVKRDKVANKVIISNVYQTNTTQVLIGEEVRIRTGFYGSNNVKVNFLNNVVEVTPY